MSVARVFSRAAAIVAAAAVVVAIVGGVMVCGCDGLGTVGGGDAPKTVKIGEVFTLNPNGSAKLVDANGADLDLSVHLEGWMICPKDADCEVQNHVIWSVKANGETVRPSYMLYDGCVCVIELPPYKIEMTGTDWKRQASFKIVRSSVDPEVDCRNVDVDARDGCIGTPPNPASRTVKIGKLTWMAKNLNVKTANNATDSSWCYGDDADNCDKYGRLYNWNAAMKACPAGWRLPDTADWNDLARAVGGVHSLSRNSDLGSWDTVGAKLKSKTGWNGIMHTQVENITVPAVESTDDYGFSALPGGYRWASPYYAPGFGNAGYNGFWWSATEYADNVQFFRDNAALSWVMSGNYGLAYENREFKKTGMSVRCVYGEAPTYTLTVNRQPATGGTVTPASPQTGIAVAGTHTVVNITAAPNEGYIFTHWTITGKGSISNANSASTSVYATGDVTVTANFTQKGGSYTGKTVKVGNLTWMAENLDIITDGSGCYGNSADCGGYGRVYNWDAAMKVCPAGWRLPDTADWNSLMEAAGGRMAAGPKLRSKTGWATEGNMGAASSDALGFSALPGGFRLTDGSFTGVGTHGFWWSATEHGRGDAYYQQIHYNVNQVNNYSRDKDSELSVRCVK